MSGGIEVTVLTIHQIIITLTYTWTVIVSTGEVFSDLSVLSTGNRSGSEIVI